MRNWRFLFCTVALFVAGSAATPANGNIVVLLENFDDDIDNNATDAPFVKADSNTSPTSFFVSTAGADWENDYWGIHDPAASPGTADFDSGTFPTQTVPDAGAIPAFTNFIGNYLVGENLDQHTNTAFDDIPLSLTWNNLNIAGLTGLQFSGLFAAQTDEFQSGLTGDYIRVLYRIDSDSSDPTTFANLLWFSGDGGPGGDNLAVDPGFDGTGEGTALTLAAANFTAAIPSTGTTLDLRILMSSNANGEEMAFDSISITGVPEPSAFFACGLISAVVGVGAAVRRRLFS
jgi:hypothetical protein